MLSAGWGSDVYVFIALGFILIAYMEESGTSAYVAAWLITRKFLLGHPWRLLFMILLVAWVISTFVNFVAGMLLTWGFIYQICHILNYKPFDKFSTVLVFGVAMMGAISMSSVPWTGNAVVILAAFTQNTGIAVNYLHYLGYSFPVSFFAIMGYMLLCKFVFRMDVRRLKNLTIDFIDPADLLLTKARKVALLSILALVVLILLPNIVPATVAFSQALGLTGKVFIVFVVLSLIRIDGQPAFDLPKLAMKGVNWGMLVMIMATLAFVAFLGNPATGIGEFLGNLLAPVFAGQPIVIFFIIAMLLVVLMTNFMVNMVAAVILMTATFPVANILGVELTQLAYMYSMGATFALLLPCASGASVILFANTAWMKAKDIYLYGVPTIIMVSAVALLWNYIYFLF